MSKKTNNYLTDFKKAERRRNLITFGAIGAIVALMIGAVVWTIHKESVDKVPLGELTPPANVTKDYGIVYSPKDAGFEGQVQKAEIVLIEDFSCPHCGTFEAQVGPTIDNLVESGKATVEYRMVAFLDPASPTKHSSRAASAALCVREDNGMEGWYKFHKWLYENQPQEGSAGPSNNDFIKGMESLDLKVDKVCVKSEKYVPWMLKANEAFSESPYSSTPTVLVQGEQVEASALEIVKAVDAANAS